MSIVALSTGPNRSKYKCRVVGHPRYKSRHSAPFSSHTCRHVYRFVHRKTGRATRREIYRYMRTLRRYSKSGKKREASTPHVAPFERSRQIPCIVYPSPWIPLRLRQSMKPTPDILCPIVTPRHRSLSAGPHLSSLRHSHRIHMHLKNPSLCPCPSVYRLRLQCPADVWQPVD